MNIELLNELLDFVETKYVADSQIIESGQRIVYKAKSKEQNDNKFVLKISPIYPTNVARIQRELKILGEINSSYFPRSLYSQFIAEEDIKYFIDNLDPKAQADKIKYMNSLNLRPFFVTVENFIEHLSWETLQDKFKQNELEFIGFLKHVFEALNLLWNKKIVHRDLKPENILVKTNFKPTIIDLGIAKSLRGGTKIITHPFFSSPCTPQFASPEQLTNNKAEVTYKSDQFSVGVISFWVVTGVFPFGCLHDIGPEELLNNILNNRISKIRDYNLNISYGMERFIYKLLNIQPYQRFRNYEAIANNLDSIGDNK